MSLTLASVKSGDLMAEPLLDVQNLETQFLLRNGKLKAVDNVSFQLQEKETLGIVGESGSGKSVLALSLMRLVPEPPGKITNGHIFFNGEDLVKKRQKEMRSYRGKRISMIFQEPMVALNPAYTVGDQVAESYRIHEGFSKKAAYAEAAEARRADDAVNAYKRDLELRRRQREQQQKKEAEEEKAKKEADARAAAARKRALPKTRR